VFQSLAGTGVDFDQPVLDKIYEFSGGHPFLTQLICKYLYDGQIRGRVQLEVFNKAIQDCSVELCTFLREFFGELSGEEETLLDVVALSEGSANLEDLQRLLLDRNLIDLIPKAGETCKKLIDRKILKQDEMGAYRIHLS
jgi:hypothetical protein